LSYQKNKNIQQTFWKKQIPIIKSKPFTNLFPIRFLLIWFPFFRLYSFYLTGNLKYVSFQ
jgi:hypothetical protein